jgi:hypothetical protein
VDTIARRISRLLQARQRQTNGALGCTHRVVKFMVKVKLMENSVKSHVGRVMVVKVISQKRRPGMILKMKSTDRPSEANIVATP